MLKAYLKNLSYILYLNGLYLWNASLNPWMAAVAVAIDITIKIKFKVWSPSHLILSLLIFCLVINIWIGKNIVNGQYPIAPRSASISLKKGIAIARIVTIVTNMVLQISLNKFKLQMPIEYSRLIKLDFGHLWPTNDSTTPKIGWTMTCICTISSWSMITSNIQINHKMWMIIRRIQKFSVKPDMLQPNAQQGRHWLNQQAKKAL